MSSNKFSDDFKRDALAPTRVSLGALTADPVTSAITLSEALLR